MLFYVGGHTLLHLHGAGEGVPFHRFGKRGKVFYGGACPCIRAEVGECAAFDFSRGNHVDEAFDRREQFVGVGGAADDKPPVAEYILENIRGIVV